MNVFVEFFGILPLGVRVAIVLFLLIVILWRFFGKIILWILSWVPFVLEKIFRYLYLLIEMPVSALHKKFGAGFYTIENRLSHAGEMIDDAINFWFAAWHSPKEIHLKKLLLIYAFCVAFVIGPAVLKVDEKLRVGEILYIHCENSFVSWLTEHVGDDSAVAALEQEKQMESELSDDDSFEITLVVSGVNSSLLVRDIPDTQNCVVLERLYNSDKVIWRGRMVFSETDNGHVEPWAKVITANGVEGWSRLYYLQPEQYSDMEFYVTEYVDGQTSER